MLLRCLICFGFLHSLSLMELCLLSHGTWQKPNWPPVNSPLNPILEHKDSLKCFVWSKLLNRSVGLSHLKFLCCFRKSSTINVMTGALPPWISRPHEWPNKSWFTFYIWVSLGLHWIGNFIIDNNSRKTENLLFTVHDLTFGLVSEE